MLKIIDFSITLIVIIFSVLGFIKIFRFYKRDVDESVNIINIIKSDNILNYKDNKFISIIIPARNEEKRIGNLLKSLQNQSYKDFEVIVVDDNSSDNTKKIVEAYAIKINKDKKNLEQTAGIDIYYYKLPEGDWKGKTAACFFGALKAKGDFFLFLDADIFLTEDAIEYISKNATFNAIVSIQPYHQLKKLYEQFSLYSNIIAFLGLDLGKFKNPYKTRSGLFGPCVLIPKKIYQSSSGHLIVKDSILEDMELGIELSKRNIDLYSIPHMNKVKFRMYGEGFKYLFDGWTKNMVLGASKSNILSILIISSLVTLSISLPLSILIYFFQSVYVKTLFYCFGYLIFVLLLYLAARKIGSFSIISCFLFPIFAIFYLIIFIRSVFMKIFKIPINWRGRKVVIK